MFTVVILEQEHLESIRQYRDFLAPFLKNEQIALCRWRPEGQTLLETVPELHDCVARLMDEPDTLAAMQKGAVEIFHRRFTGEIFAGNIEAVYDLALKD